MKEILFKKDELTNLEFSLNREILRANMSNAYACTTLAGCNTRKYHGLLIVPQPQIDDNNHVLLSSLDETIIQNNNEFHLGIHRYKEGIYYPKGHKYLESYQLKNLPITSYRIGDILLTKEIQIQQRRDRVLIKYTLQEASSNITLELRPLLAFRQVHKLSYRNDEANTSYKNVENGVSYQLYENYTPLYIQLSKKMTYEHKPDWYYNFEYIKEKERGYDYTEDLLMPGVFSVELKPGECFYLSCGIEEGSNPLLLSRDFKREASIRFDINTMEDVLKRAARMFFCRKNLEVNIVAGFPWFGRWGRDTFISLPGLCLGVEDMQLLISATDTMLKDLKDGLFPNIGVGESAAYNSADTPLWFFWCLQQYANITGEREKVWKKYGKKMKSIINSLEEGCYNVRMDSNYLLWQGENGKALTWMDAIVNGVPVTQRKGYAVEINALWYNAIMFTKSLAEEYCDDAFVEKWTDFSSAFKTAFKEIFWSKDLGYLADYVDGTYKDFSVRPNMIFAVSLEYSPLSIKIRQLIVEKVKSELLTPRGLNTLSPKDKNYKGYYFGDQNNRDYAYHNGTVWPWLLGAFSEAYLRVYGKDGVDFIESIYKGFEDVLCDYCVGSIAEVYDGNPPFKAGGSISQAWSVAALIRMKYLIDSYKNK
ncbi:MAG: glycogen debranching enzyme family protein [Bacteroidales bacterium]|nr:glycogen debranching enzyme family protein [Bacteroidales bacterium]